MPREKISWTKIGLFSLGGSAALIGYLYYKRRYPKYEEIEPAPKIESLDKAKDELVKIILPDRLCTFHAGLGTTISIAYFSYLKIECALKASVAYVVASQVSKLKVLDFEVSWWPVTTQGQDTLTAGEILELIIKLSTTTYLAQQASRDLLPALGIVGLSSAPCLLDCIWIPRHRSDRIERLIRDHFVPELPLLATFISSRKEYFRVELIRDIRSIYAANKKSEYVSQQDLVNELADKMITRIVRYILRELGKETKKKLPSYAYVC